MNQIAPPKNQKGLKKDDFKLGLSLGLLAPAFVFAIIYAIDHYFAIRLDKEFIMKDGTKLVIGVGINVLIFRYYMIKLRMEQTGKGVLAATFIYAIFYMIYFIMLDNVNLF